MTNLQNETVENEVIELAGPASHRLGPRLTLKGCTVVLSLREELLTIGDVRLVECRIEAKKPVVGVPWADCFITGSTLTGTFRDCDFGDWPEEEGVDAGIEDCDLSAATLDGCRFIGCDASTLTFPGWPCFTILDPVSRRAELEELTWPGQAGILPKTFEDFPPETAAVTYLAGWVERELGAPQDELKALLEGLEGVVM